MKNGLAHALLVRIVPFLLAHLLRLWFATCRVGEHGSDNRRTAFGMRDNAIAIFWHYSLVYVFYHLRSDSAAVLVSASEDGEYIARLARHLNFTTIRGSKNRRGMRALKELLLCLDRGENIGMVADGSQGPPLIVQPGSILLASRTGVPILPIVWSASRYLTFKSWDRTAVPAPFSRIDFFYGEPLLVPSDCEGDAIEAYRRQLEKQMNDMYRDAWSRYGKAAH